jgi:hypothetical protein
MFKRVALAVAGVLAAWLVLLLVLGFLLGSRQERHTRARLAESLQARVAIAGSDLALIRGRLRLTGLGIQRDDAVGHLSIEVGQVRCELAPLGVALLDRDCRELAVRGVRLEVSTAALFKLQRPKQKPIRADAVVIDDATLVFLPNAFVPNLGRIEIEIQHAESGPTLLRTPLSWLFALRELRATLALPAGITLHLAYEAGVLTASGSVFGTSPVALPIELPVADAARDAAEETRLLGELGKDIAERLVAKRAKDWLQQKLF